jgi:hypothetical protein
MKAYVVRVSYTQHYTGSVIITARNLTHAKELADTTIDPADVPELEPVDGDLRVNEVVEANHAAIVGFDKFRKRELAEHGFH